MTRQISKEEFKNWFTKYDLPAPDDTMLEEMESEGIVFKIRTTDGAEHPFINADNWIGKEQE
jgi:hypothetical protein